jgi:hypothetical protein
MIYLCLPRELICITYNVSHVSRSLGLVIEIRHLKTKLNRNLQIAIMPKFWLAAFSCGFSVVFQYQL